MGFVRLAPSCTFKCLEYKLKKKQKTPKNFQSFLFISTQARFVGKSPLLLVSLETLMPYSPPSQIIARQLDYFNGKHLLLAGELEDTYASELRDIAASISLFTTNLIYAKKMQRFEGIEVQFSECYKKQNKIDMVLFYWPKAKAEAAFLLSMLMSSLGEGTEIVVVGENRSGVKSIEKLFLPYGKITKFDSARRCSFYWGQCEQTSSFVFDDWFTDYPLMIEGKALTIRSLPGVFSQGELDLGSQLLIESLPKQKGTLLDFGCGAGVLGAAILQRYPNVKVTLVDVSALAVFSAKETLRINNLSGLVFASDIYSEISSKFDTIISNPPFHKGINTHYSATETFLEEAPKHLHSQGELFIVANHFLRYPEHIEKAFGHCNLIKKNNKFSIYHAKKQ